MKSRSTKPFVIRYELYPFDILVCPGTKREEIVKELKKFGTTLNEEEDKALQMYGKARTVMLIGGQTIVWTKSYPNKGCHHLAHEIFHAVHFLFDRIGITLSMTSDEAFAYAIEYITKKINQKLYPANQG